MRVKIFITFVVAALCTTLYANSEQVVLKNGSVWAVHKDTQDISGVYPTLPIVFVPRTAKLYDISVDPSTGIITSTPRLWADIEPEIESVADSIAIIESELTAAGPQITKFFVILTDSLISKGVFKDTDFSVSVRNKLKRMRELLAQLTLLRKTAGGD